jgi:16S rRNA (guanine(966)-N(2))-methyltransferase RsmD
MRVIGGKAKGIKLQAVPGDTTRPILDRVRTSLFDILRPSITDINMLDMFAGTGSVGIEALSQGARSCTFLDMEKRAIDVVQKNLEATGLTHQATVKHMDAFRFLRTTKHSFDLIYVAPPQYESLWEQAMQTIAERPNLLNADGMIIVQIDPKEYEELQLSHFEEVRQKRYGNTLLVFFEPRAS